MKASKKQLKRKSDYQIDVRIIYAEERAQELRDTYKLLAKILRSSEYAGGHIYKGQH